MREDGIAVKKGLTKAGLGPVEDKDFIEKAALYGFDAVDLNVHGIMGGLGTGRARELLERNGIAAGACDLPVNWRAGEAEFLDGLKELNAFAAAAASLGCRACCTYILPSTDEKPAPYMARTIRRLKLCAEVLSAHGIRLGLEFVGPHHLRTAWKYPFIWTVDETLETIDAIGQPGVGLLVDFYHCFTTGFTAEEMRKLQPEQIVHVHINDARNLPVEQLLDNDRLYPGEGVIDLAGYLRALRQVGYEGIVSQEILMPEQPSGPADERLERSRAGFAKVFGEAFS